MFSLKCPILEHVTETGSLFCRRWCELIDRHEKTLPDMHCYILTTGHQRKRKYQYCSYRIGNNKMSFGSKSYMGVKEKVAYEKSFVGKYQQLVKKNSFLYFGLPMMLSIALGSVLLTNFTSLRYERRDEKVKEMSEDEALSMINNRRKVDIKDEYYKLQGLLEEHEDWEPKRVERLPGESENKW